MLYKLSFTKTADGLLRVSASVGRASEHVIAIYQSDLAFLHLVKHAGLTQEPSRSVLVRLELLHAARKWN